LRRTNSSQDHCQRSGAALAVHLRLGVAARGGGELLQLLDDGVVPGTRDRIGTRAAALEKAQSLMEVVIRARLLAVEVHQVVLGGRGVARVEGRERAILVLEDQARDVRIIARENKAHEPAAYGFDRPEKILEHVAVVDADLQHHATRHAFRGIAPRAEIDLAEAIAADVRLRVHQSAKFMDSFFYPPEVAFAAPLVAEGQHHLRPAARVGDRACIGNRVGDRLVEKHMLSRRGRGERGFAVHPVRRGVDDRLDLRVVQDFLVRACGAAAVFLRDFLSLLGRPAIAGGDAQPPGALDGVGEHVRPPAHAEAGDPHCAEAPIDSTASRASRSSSSQLPPATPTPPMHSPPTMTGQPPSIAVQRSGPAARASPRAWATSSDWPWAPFAPVILLFDPAQTAFVVAECTVWKRPPSMRSSSSRWPPASAMATVTAMPASCARAIAVAIIFLAPAAVSRLLSAKSMRSSFVIY